MPTASAIAAPSVALAYPAPTAPNATPTARPSGMLCSVMASTRRAVRRHVVDTPSTEESGAKGCRCGSNQSAMRMAPAPARNPTSGGSQLTSPISSDSAMDGARSDQNDAAIITPAANPSAPSSRRRSTLLKKKTTAAPIAVMAQVKTVATSACAIGLRLANPLTIGGSYHTGFAARRSAVGGRRSAFGARRTHHLTLTPKGANLYS